jgi:predicted nucleic acid-binding protein
MKIYLDNCCFNRPFDDQASVVIRLETDAKLHVQDLIRNGTIELCWSFVWDYENSRNPFPEARTRIEAWKSLSSDFCLLSPEISQLALRLMSLGLKQLDAAHIACAIHMGADCFLTTDKKILNKKIDEIFTLNPIDFVRRFCNE